MQYFCDVDNTVKKCITYFGLIVYLCVMAVVNRHRITVNLEFTFRENLLMIKERYELERGRVISESKFLEMCLAEWYNLNRERGIDIKVSEDEDFA